MPIPLCLVPCAALHAACNAFGEDAFDFPSALARARTSTGDFFEDQASFLGIWPTFSLANHDCCPNAVSLVVRAGWWPE